MVQPRQTEKKNLHLTTNQPTRSDELLITAILIALLLLIGIVGLFWSTWNRIVLAPTSTPTITRVQTVTSTPDIQSTQIVFQLETQTVLAQQVAQLRSTETAITNLMESATQTTIADLEKNDMTSTANIAATMAVSSATDLTQANTSSPAESATSPTPTDVKVFIPGVNTGRETDDFDDLDESSESDLEVTATIATKTSIAPQIEITATVKPEDQPQTDTTISLPAFFNDKNSAPAATVIVAEVLTVTDAQPQETNVQTPIINDAITIAPTETQTPIPPTETPTPTLTPTRFVQRQLNARVNIDKAKLRTGPGGGDIGEIEINREVSLTSRNGTGEWLNVCCLNGQVGWLRQAQLTIEGNVLDEGAPEDANPNDVRWLNVDGDPNFIPPQVLPIPDGTYPILRGNSANNGNIGQLPLAPVTEIWESKQGLASAPIMSPISISTNGIFVSTEDGHLYSFNKETGNEQWRWRYEGDPPRRVTTVAVVKDAQLYVVDEFGAVYRIEDRITSAAQIWKIELKTGDQADAQSLTPVTDIAVQDICLYIGAKNGETLFLVSIRQSDGRFCFTAKNVDGGSMQYPAIGGQLIFVATDRGVFAKDVSSGDPVWGQLDNFTDISAPPVYSYPGVDALAELYIVREGGEIIALDANTGRQLWSYASGETVTGLSLNSKYLYATGIGFIKVISRAEHGQVANIGVNGAIPSGPLLSPTNLLALSDSGEIFFIDPFTFVQLTVPTGRTGIRNYVANGSILYFHNGGTAVGALRGQ